MVKCKKCNNREKDADAIDVTFFVMSMYIRLGNYLKFKVCHNVYSMHLVIFHEEAKKSQARIKIYKSIVELLLRDVV